MSRNKTRELILGPRQWTHPEVYTEVLQQFNDLMVRNPDAANPVLHNAAVELTREKHRIETIRFYAKYDLRGLL